MTRRVALLALAAAWLALAPGAAWAQGGAAAAQPAVHTVMVAMRDGVHLATDVYLPEGQGPGPWPTILARTPYSRKAGAGLAPGFTRLGYALVAQDSRGRFESEGANLPFLFDGWGEQQDGVDTLAWVADQPWCDGKIGTWGGSALGITQVLTAAANPPELACQLIQVACGNLYTDACYVGGAWTTALVEAWLKAVQFDDQAKALMLEHSCYDDFWRGLDANARADQVHVPGVFVGGWYDIFSQPTLDAFVARQEHGGEGAKGRQWLIMGPWTHGRGAKAGELTYPDNSRQAPNELDGLAWFDQWLKGKDNGVTATPHVSYFVMGAIDEPGAPGNEWRTADRWPVDHSPTSFYLQPDGTLSTTTQPADGAAKTYSYDPANPVPSKGGNNLTIPAGSFDQREVENRPDVLTFTSAALEQPLELTGPVRARLWVSSSAPDTDFTVKLCDVYPDGRSMLVVDGILRMRHRNSIEREEPMQPGEVYPVIVDLWATSLIVNRGHRLRVDVSSSNYPRFSANANTGEALGASDHKQVADNTVYLDAARPSQVVLPVVAAQR